MECEPPSHPDPAPALSRGLELIRLLSVDGQASLEQLARTSGWPKSSTRRYLQALEMAGVVRQITATKIWQLRQVLRPLRIEEGDVFATARLKLSSLAMKTAHCAELYRCSEGRVELIDRADPETGEFMLTARIGYKRDLTELDSTAMILYAHEPERIPRHPLWCWKNGERATFSPSERDQLLEKTRTEGHAIDLDFNIKGIRRFATPLRRGGHLAGIVVVAQRQTPRAEEEFIDIINPLLNFLS